MNYEKLIQKAIEAKKFSYSKYSKFRVGAVAVFENEKIFTGTNVENSSYGATVCAERVAILKGVSEGSTELNAIILNTDEKDIVYPCGICRQIISEFANDDTEIICTNNEGGYKTTKFIEILPHRFFLSL